MTPFAGFPEGRSRPTPVPAEFFNILLPEIDTLGELRVTLYVLWYLERQESLYHQFRATEITSDLEFMNGFSSKEGALEYSTESCPQAGGLTRHLS